MLMSDLIISYQLWTWIGAILAIQRTGRKRQQFLLCPLYHLNHRKQFHCWKCQFFTDYPPHKAPFWGLHSSLSFIYLCGCWCPLPSVSSLFSPLWFGIFFFHVIGCAAQLYQSAVLSLSILKGSFTPLTGLEEKRFSWLWTSLLRSYSNATTQMKQKFEFWLFTSKLKIAVSDWKSLC